MKEARCKFCDDLRFMRRLDLAANDGQRTLYKRYSVALVSTGYSGREKKGQTTHYDYHLRYCPECGRRMRWKGRGQ